MQPHQEALPVANKRLENKLRVYRKKAGYTLPHASFLLGSRDPRYFGRLERGERQPTGPDIYSCERIFCVPNFSLFPGLRLRSYEKADRHMAALNSRLRAMTPRTGSASRRILQVLASLADHLRPIVGTLGV